jgi:hypothetical protein
LLVPGHLIASATMTRPWLFAQLTLYRILLSSNRALKEIHYQPALQV